MLINLDISLSENLREKIVSSGNHSYTKRGRFKIPGKNKKVESDAYNCICTIMDRIDSLVEHCNSLNVDNKSVEGEFALLDVLNYGQTLIDCIDMLGKIYSDSWNEKNTNEIFAQPGENGKGNDEKYFKYLRSLCSVHPVETTGYPMYQGNEPEWCPYIRSGNDSLSRLKYGDDAADFYAVVYRNDQCTFKEVPIYIEQVFKYIQMRYKSIEMIIQLIDEYDQERINELKELHIKTPEECDDYKCYLMNLANENDVRYGKANEHHMKEWEAIIETHFNDSSKECWLVLYKKELYEHVKRVHKHLQAMECDSDEWDMHAFENTIWNKVDNYSYEIGKIYDYLYPEELETDQVWEFSFIDREPEICDEKVKEIFEIVDQIKDKNCTHDEMIMFYRGIEQRYKPNNSEWSRIYLKIVEDVFDGVWHFDYYLNNWHVWLQIQLAQWSFQRGSK